MNQKLAELIKDNHVFGQFVLSDKELEGLALSVLRGAQRKQLLNYIDSNRLIELEKHGLIYKDITNRESELFYVNQTYAKEIVDYFIIISEKIN